MSSLKLGLIPCLYCITFQPLILISDVLNHFQTVLINKKADVKYEIWYMKRNMNETQETKEEHGNYRPYQFEPPPLPSLPENTIKNFSQELLFNLLHNLLTGVCGYCCLESNYVPRSCGHHFINFHVFCQTKE